MIDVVVNGKHYQEMHGDGGASRQVFVYLPNLKIAEQGYRDQRNPQRSRGSTPQADFLSGTVHYRIPWHGINSGAGKLGA